MALRIEQYYMSVQQPWAFLIANGYKKCENRHGNFPKKAIGECIAIHATKIKQAQRRHHAYQIAQVQQYLGMIEETQMICKDNEALDKFFEKSIKSIIGIVKLDEIINKADLDENAEVLMKQRYPFYDVGQVTDKKLLFGESYVFTDPIQNVKGTLGIRVLEDPSALKEVRKGVADIEYRIRSTRQQQDQDVHLEEQDLKRDSDDDVCPMYDNAKSTDKQRFVIKLSVPSY